MNPALLITALSLGTLLAPGLTASADVSPEWIATVPAGTSLSAGLGAAVVTADGVTCVTGTAGPSSNTDILTSAWGPDGSLLWSKTYNGPNNWHDQGRGIALGADGDVWVVGNTPGPGSFANVLLLRYDLATGDLLDSVIYSSGPGLSEHGQAVAVGADGTVFVTGGTVGDGGDAMTLAFDAAGSFLWKRVYDGPAFGPFSQDSAWKLLLDPEGNPVTMIHGVMNSNHPDFVLIKYAAASGATSWSMNFGVNGGDFATDMVMDEGGDLYVTGTGINGIDKYLTIKVRGSDGMVLWSAYDAAGGDDSGRAVALDGKGGVYLTGSSDPDGNLSNFNNNIFTVKRDAATGAFLWSHLYGANCVGCFDVGLDVVVDPAGQVLVAGETASPPYASDAIVLVLDPATGEEIDRGSYSGGELQTAAASFIGLDEEGNAVTVGDFYHVNTGVVHFAAAGFAAIFENVRPLAGDIDGDGAVGAADLGTLLADWGPCPAEGGCPCDLDGDGDVDGADLGILLGLWT